MMVGRPERPEIEDFHSTLIYFPYFSKYSLKSHTHIHAFHLIHRFLTKINGIYNRLDKLTQSISQLTFL